MFNFFFLFFSKIPIYQPSGSPYHTILPLDTTSNEAWSLAQQLKQHRSNSYPDSLDDSRPSGIFGDFSRSLLGDTQKHLYDTYKKCYADILYRWGLLVPRAKVLKYLSAPIDVFRGVEFVTECLICMKITRAPSCVSCRKPLLSCMLCRLPVRGSSNACLNCGHGGHTEHMRMWFEVSCFDDVEIGEL
jgi:WD repeat-containing protein 59